MNTHFISNLMFSLELFGTMIFAISGAISAVRSEFDLTGVVLIACVVGNGGGTIRDVLIRAPVFWFNHWSYLAVSILTGILTFGLMRYIDLARRLILISDAIGLGVFAITGTQKALLYGLNPFIAVIMGLITSIGGGLIRDTLCNQKPLVLRAEIYALAATAGSTVFVLMPIEFRNYFVTWVGCALLVTCLRLFAVKYKIHMPTIHRD